MADQSHGERVSRRFAEADDPHPDPPDPPAGWEGGAVEETDAGRGRVWVEPDRGLRVTYSLDDPTVTAEHVQWDDSREMWAFSGIAASDRHVDCDSDEEAMIAAFELMQGIADGDVDLDGSELDLGL